MRTRHKPWAQDALASHPEWIIQNPDDQQGQWHEVFENDQPLHVEIGTGKGQFIIEMAKENPDLNFVGIERISDVLVMALKKALDTDLTNLRFIRGDGGRVSSIFGADEVDQIYLNFSDPWPKKRHTKRRLTSPGFLAEYEKVLRPEGAVTFKTDNQGFFEYSLCAMSQYGMYFDEISLDLHHSGIQNNVMTEYEEKFSRQGKRIYRLVARFREST